MEEMHVDPELKELEEAFHFGGLFSFFLAIAIGVFLNKLCPRYKWDQSPPGPAEFRGIGNLHQVARGNSTLEKIQRWVAIYGQVVAVTLGHTKMVILSGYETIREAYLTPQFSRRLLLKPFHQAGVVSEEQKEALSVALPHDQDVVRRLKNFSLGNVSENVMVTQNVSELVQTLRMVEGKEINKVQKLLTENIVKSLATVISGRMVNHEDFHFQNILESVEALMESTTVSSGPTYFFSSFFSKKAESAFLKNNNNMEKSEADSPSITDAYLMDVDKLPEFSAKYLLASGNQNIGDIVNLLAVTTENSRDTILWALYFLIKHPQIQEQFYQEIVDVLGKRCSPSLDDLNRCPFAQAVIEEVFRLTSLAPLGYLHQASEDLMFQGHFIPRDTLICANIYALHHEPKVWTDPEVLRPNRFLTRDPDVGHVLPFSFSRTCLAELLTRNLTFLYLTSLVQKFQFSAGSSNDKPLELGASLSRAPREFGIVARPRY